MLDGGDAIVALLDVDFVVRPTGRRVSERDEAHVFHLDAGGRLAKFRHIVDTFQHHEAWGGGRQ